MKGDGLKGTVQTGNTVSQHDVGAGSGRDDPMVPLAPFLSTEASENSSVLAVTPHYGGHVGFVSGEGDLGRFRAEAIVMRFCYALSSPLES